MDTIVARRERLSAYWLGCAEGAERQLSPGQRSWTAEAYREIAEGLRLGRSDPPWREVRVFDLRTERYVETS